jgi:hypothetical protein
VHGLERALVHRAAGRVEVDRLAARHADRARRLREQRARRRRVAQLRAPERLERLRLQRVAGEQRGRLAERDVAGRPAAPHRVVVHRRQVVVHERIRVDHLDGAAGASTSAGSAPANSPAAYARSARTRLPPPSVA